MIQKFQRGNIVRILFGHPIWQWSAGTKTVVDMQPEEVGKLAVIEYSYAEKYGGSNTSDYSVMFLDNGISVAWKTEDQLEFVEHGGEYLIQQAHESRNKLRKMNTDLRYIKSNWRRMLNEGMNSDIVLFLFNKIGIKSSFVRNGEYFALWSDWYQTLPLYDLIFTQKSKEKILNCITDDKLRCNVEKFYDEVQQVV